MPCRLIRILMESGGRDLGGAGADVMAAYYYCGLQMKGPRRKLACSKTLTNDPALLCSAPAAGRIPISFHLPDWQAASSTTPHAIVLSLPQNTQRPPFSWTCP